MTNPQEILATIAESYLAVHEEPRGSNRGPQLAAIFGADDYDPNGAKPGDEGYPWCASAVSLWVQRFLATDGARILFPGVRPPRLSSAFSFRTWARNNGALIFTPGQVRAGVARHQRGDIVVFGFSHVGVVATVHQRDTNFASVEGNTDRAGSREGWEVALRPRTLADVSAKNPAQGCFIRLSPRALPVKGGRA